MYDGEKSPLPCFHGVRGPEVVRSLLEIEATFEKNLQILKDVKKTILDVKVGKNNTMFDLTFVILAVCESCVACEFWGVPGSSRFFAAYVLLASQNSNPSIVYLLACYRHNL